MTHIQDGMKHIFPKDFIKIYKDKSTIIIDIREPYELVDLPFENATNIPLNNLLTKYKEYLRTDRTYYILCHHGQRSYLVTEVLYNNGYNVVNVVGGVDLVNRFDSVNNEG